MDYCLQIGILYESVPHHNAVFVGMDETEQEGSNKQYSFCVPPLGISHRVAVYEACIDALAHMSLEDGRADKYRLSLGGITAPKERTEQHR